MEYDYDLQVWFDPKTHVIKGCNHPENMRLNRKCCNAYRFAGQTVEAAKKEVTAA